MTGVLHPGPIEPSPGVVSGENATADRHGTVGLSPTKQPPLIHCLQLTYTNNPTMLLLAPSSSSVFALSLRPCDSPLASCD